MSMTDLLVIVVAVLFVLVLLDGLRRKLSARNRVVLKLDRSMQTVDLDEEELTRSELPNGGARTKPRASDVPPRPPRPAPKLSVLQPGWKEQRAAAGAPQASVAVAAATAAAAAVQPRDVPVLLDTVEVEEERIEHTNVYADSSAIPVDAVTTRTAVPTPQEETMGIYQDDIDTTLPDLVSDLAADRPLLAGGGDDEDDWEEEWEEEEEDEEEDEESDEESDDGEYWEEVWEDEEDEYDEEEDDEEDDEYEDEYEDEDDYDDQDDEDDEDDYDDEEDEDDEERFPDEDEDDLDTWNRRVAAAPSAASQGAVQAVDDSAPPARFEPGFSADSLDDWELGAEPDFGPADADLFAAVRQPAPAAVAEAAPAAAAVATAASTERRSLFGGVTPGRKHQGELFQEEPAATSDDDVDTPQEVIVINVMARPGQLLSGSELLPVLQLQGLRLGDMSIFHKYSGSHGTGSVVFSMVNMVKPGTFDLATMDSFTTPGISFFLQLPSKHGNMASFEQMLGVANAVRTALDAELKDEHRNVLTRQTLEHYRQRIRDFELSLLTRR